MARFDKLVGFLVSISNYAVYAGLVVMCLFITVSVVMRYVLHNALAGSVEVVELLMAAVVLLGLAGTQRKKGHVTMEVLLERLRPNVRAWFDMAGYLVGVVFCVIVSWRGVVQALKSGSEGESSLVWRIPYAPFRWMVFIGFAILALALMASAAGALRKARNRS